MKGLNQLFRSLNWKSPSRELKINPQCLRPDFYHFVGADGIYYPCCFTRTFTGRKNLNALLGPQVQELNMRLYNRKTILQSSAWKKIVATFYDEPMDVCQTFCPKIKAASSNWGQPEGVNRGLSL